MADKELANGELKLDTSDELFEISKDISKQVATKSRTIKNYIKPLLAAMFFVFGLIVSYITFGLYKKEKKYNEHYKPLSDNVFVGLVLLSVLFYILSIIMIVLTILRK